MNVALRRNEPLVTKSLNPEQFQVYTERHFDRIQQLNNLPNDIRLAMKAVAQVLPFRVNQYVIDQLINWRNVPDDPIFRLTFPQPEMLSPKMLRAMVELLKSGADQKTINALAAFIRQDLNPHPAEQQTLNVPQMNGVPLTGLQHKYEETLLFFPRQGQTCHSYCTFCFRWAQFIGDKSLKFANSDILDLHKYLIENPQISDLLLTGGDPMVMNTRNLANYVIPLLDRKFEHVRTIRFGSKALTFWPYRFVRDRDADDLLRLFDKLIAGGKHVAFMAHYNHPRELETSIAREAISRLRSTGVVIRSQGPLLSHINDSAEIWSKLWKTQVSLGVIPYYMFVERDTGARQYFEVPLYRAHEIYREAVQGLSGLGRSARGPSMSAGPGKVEVQGTAEIEGQKVFVLRFIQGRNPDWVHKPFFAKFDSKATWFDQLKPAFEEREFFFEPEYKNMLEKSKLH